MLEFFHSYNYIIKNFKKVIMKIQQIIVWAAVLQSSLVLNVKILVNVLDVEITFLSIWLDQFA